MDKIYITKLYIEGNQLFLESADGRTFGLEYDYTGLGGALNPLEVVEFTECEDCKNQHGA